MKCPICHSDNSRLLKKIDDYKPLILSFNLKEPDFDNVVSLDVKICKVCSHIFIETLFEELDSFYKNSPPRGGFSLKLSSRDLMAKEVLDDLIVSYDIESFCEIGSGCGGFAANLSKKRKFNQIVLIDPILEKTKK